MGPYGFCKWFLFHGRSDVVGKGLDGDGYWLHFANGLCSRASILVVIMGIDGNCFKVALFDNWQNMLDRRNNDRNNWFVLRLRVLDYRRACHAEKSVHRFAHWNNNCSIYSIPVFDPRGALKNSKQYCHF